MRNLKNLLCLALWWLLTASPHSALAFVHPGISHTQADLDRMKSNVNVEPYKTAYEMFKNQGYSSYSNTGQGPFASVSTGNHEFSMRNDATVCHYNAIMWYVTGDVRYRDNAINIMNGWANTLTSFDPAEHLTAGGAGLDFCNAAEIIRLTSGGVTWSTAAITKFQNMLLTYLYPSCMTPGNGHLEAAGHGGLQMKGLFAIGIFCDRQDIFDFAVSSYQHNAGWTYGLQEYIHSSGQNYETQRDQGHASGNIGTFAINAAIARNQGVDLFSLNSNLLAKAFESQAKINLLYDVAPVVWTAADGSGHNSVSPDSRQPFDNLSSDLAYNIYHDVKAINMPYTKMSADVKFPDGGQSFMYRIDNSGKVPAKPPYSEPAPKDVVLYADGSYSGSYLAHFGPGSYNSAALNAGGVTGGPWGNGSYTASSIRVPTGWSVKFFDSDNFTGNSIVFGGGNVNSLGDTGWNDRVVSMIVTGGTGYTLSNGTYKLVSVRSGQVADVSGASNAEGATVIQWPYNGSLNQLWKVEAIQNSQYKITNLNSDKALQVRDASLAGGAAIEQRSFLLASNLARGGVATASIIGGAGEQAPQAFDGNSGTKWFTGGTGSAGWLQYQFSGGISRTVTQYTITSANDASERDPFAWQLLGSSNGTTWTTLDTQIAQIFAGRLTANTYNIAPANQGAYAYYRLNVTATFGGAQGIQLSEMSLYSYPTTTAPNMATGGTASASSPGSADEQASKVFDGFSNTKWYGGGTGQTGWVQYQFASGVTQAVNLYKITSANDVQSRDPAAWQFQGSNDGTAWTTLDTQSGQVFSGRFVTNIYSTPNTTFYAYYRLKVTATYSGNAGIQVSELGLYTSNAHQRWILTPASGSAYGSFFTLKNVNSSNFLEAPPATTTTTSLTQQTGSTSTAQQWSFQTP